MRTRARLLAASALAGAVLAGCGGGEPEPVRQTGASLFEAVGRGDAAEVRALLERGADPNRRGERGRTPLIEAAWGNHVEVARALIDAGGNVNIEDDTEQSAYLIATSEGYVELLEVTLEAGADVDAKDSYNGTGLIRAAERGHARVVRRLLEAGIDRDHVNELGWTALHEAILLGPGGPLATATVRELVAGGVDVDKPDGDGVRPLAHARERGFTEIAAILTRAGARELPSAP